MERTKQRTYKNAIAQLLYSVFTLDEIYLAAATGHEFALFRNKTEDILIRGDESSFDIAGKLGQEILDKKYEWVAHSHVDKGTLTASSADRETLRRLGQRKSILVGVDGEVRQFGQSPFDD